MKAIKQIIVKMAVGCVLALGLITNVHAESYYSAKDPDIAPLPFNPHPECPVTQVSPGIYVVDDTAIPDTPEQVAARKLRQTAAQEAKLVDPQVAHATTVLAERERYQKEFAPWVIQNIQASDGGMLTTEVLDKQRKDGLLALSTNIYNDSLVQHAAVANFVETNAIGMPANWLDANGNPMLIDHLDDNGSAAIKGLFNLESAQTVSAQKLWPGGTSGFSINGTNVLMGEWDGGDVLTNHEEFAQNGSRVTLINGGSGQGLNDHATHVCGTMAAWGIFNLAEGFANRGKVIEGYFGNDIIQMPVVAATNALRVSNHSYGYNWGWSIYPVGTNQWGLWSGDVTISTNQDWHFGFYDSVAKTNDQIIYTAQTYLPVFAAGNERGVGQHGPDSQPVLHWEYSNGVPYQTTHIRPLNDANNGGFNTLGSYSVSKNALVIGADNGNTNGYTGTNSVVMSYFSSWGPTADGRIKPDICADGVNIWSSVAQGTNIYQQLSGTSQATPAVTGTLGLMVGLYQQLYPTNAPLLLGSNAPLSSTLRGIVIHTVDQTGGAPGPNYTFGWGQLNALSAANLISNSFASGSIPFIKEVRLVSGDYVQFPVVLTNNKPFKATITWTDPPGTPTSPKLNPTNHMLVNDLDLRITTPSGATNFPWVLNRNSPTNAATTGDNTVDNVEQVSIPNPTNGTYLVQITHKGNLVNDQGQTSYQNVSIMLSGNIAQPPILPNITSIAAITSSNTTALAWSSEVGRVYRVQYVDALSSSNNVWQYTSSELSATKTNTAVTLDVTGVTNRFYRVVQVR